MSADILAVSLAELSTEIRGRRISSVEATRACLDAIAAGDERVNCFVCVERDTALEQAHAADRVIEAGNYRGPLHGVPLAHKDMFYRAGKVSTGGSRILRDQVATMTATIQERLRLSGAVYLGSLNMSEFAAGPTGHNEHYGHCRNPWNPRHVCGGSSSGSAAAVAARFAFGSLGSDTGGSIRLPAAMCGVVGLKPTYGLISRHGVMPRCWSLDVVGPIARTAEDCALLLHAVAGRDDRDPTTATRAVPEYSTALKGSIRGWKIGVPTNPIFEDIESGVRGALDASLRQLEALGATVERIELPDPRVLYALTNLVNKAEAATLHARWVRERRNDYSLSAVNRFEAGFHIPATYYLDALRIRGRLLADFVKRVFGRVDVVHLPVIGVPVPTLEDTEITRTAGAPELIERITRHTRWVSYLGIPGLSVPCGFDASGLPIGFQLLGRPFAEARLLRLAHVYQQATDWHRRSPTREALAQRVT